MEKLFIEIGYVNGKVEKFTYGEESVDYVAWDPGLTIYFKDGDKKWRKVISVNKILSYTTNIDGFFIEI